MQVLNSKEASKNSQKLQSLPVKESHKAAQSSNEDADKTTHKDLNKRQGSKAAGTEQNGSNPKRHKTEKRKMNCSEGGQKKPTDKRKKVEEVEKKVTEYVYMH